MMAVEILMFSGRPIAQPPFMIVHLERCAESRHPHHQQNSTHAHTYILIETSDELGDIYLTV